MFKLRLVSDRTRARVIAAGLVLKHTNTQVPNCVHTLINSCDHQFNTTHPLTNTTQCYVNIEWTHCVHLAFDYAHIDGFPIHLYQQLVEDARQLCIVLFWCI